MRDLVRSRGLGDVYKRQAVARGADRLELRARRGSGRGDGIHLVLHGHLVDGFELAAR